MRVWRISKARHATTAFTGDGARLFGARWNPAGTPVVYTSLSLSLAVIETFLHLDAKNEPDSLVSIAADLPMEESAAERVTSHSLPLDWRAVNHPALQEIGREWVASRRSLALLVPSVAVEGEWNALINPEHPEAHNIKILETRTFEFDHRMFKNRS